MASLIPPSKSRGADVSVGEALRQLGERVAVLEAAFGRIDAVFAKEGLTVERAAEALAEVPEKAPTVAPEKDAKSKTDAKSA